MESKEPLAQSAAYNYFENRRFLWLLVLFVTAAYASLSILRHWHFISSAYDLGLFDQAIWQLSRFNPPLISVRSNLLNENLFGDHFHPILILLAPVYWFTDRVEVLLAIQALLFAIAIVPIFLFTEKRLGRSGAYLCAFVYALFWGIHKAVEFDFHEIAFAVPVIAFAIYSIDERRWKSYFVCIFLMLITKENLPILVFFFGIYLMTLRQFKYALISMVVGAIGFVTIIKLLIPYFSGPETSPDRPGKYYRYWSYNHLGAGPAGLLVTLVKNPLLVIQTLFTPRTKMDTYWYLFHPFLFLPILSPLFILAIPLLAERFLSEGYSLWSVDYHYNSSIAPVLVMAAVDSIHRLTQRLKNVNSMYLVIPVILVILVLNLRLLQLSPIRKLADQNYWRLSESDKSGRRALSLIPANASVITQSTITPHLTHRKIVYLLNPFAQIPDADFIIASERLSPYPYPTYAEISKYLDSQQARGYRKVFEENGWIVLKSELQPGHTQLRYVVPGLQLTNDENP